MGTIVVGVDGSEQAASALRWAVAEGRLRGSDVTAVLAWDYLDQHHADGTRDFRSDYGEDDARRDLDAMVEGVLGAEATGVGRLAVCDLPATALVDAAEGADLLVVGARGLGGFRGLLLGSVSEQVLGRARCPVAVLRHGHDAEAAGAPGASGVPRIVVGVDGSATALAALAWAVEEARLRAATVVAVHSWHLPAVADVAPGAIDLRLLEEAASDVLEAAVATVDADGLAGGVRRVLTGKGPAPALLEEADGADLVVVGSRGRGGFGALLLGSVSHQLAHHAPCPVIVIPRAPDEPDSSPA